MEEPYRKASSLFSLSYRNWPMIFIVVVLGAMIGVGGGSLVPAKYRAVAYVNVDHNVDEILETSDKYARAIYLNSETVRLESILYADALWARVVTELIEQGWGDQWTDRDQLMRMVSSPHPMDGEWRFVAETRDKLFSAQLANTWVEEFIHYIEELVSSARVIESEKLLESEFANQLASQIHVCAVLNRQARSVMHIQDELDKLSEGFAEQELLTLRLDLIHSEAGEPLADSWQIPGPQSSNKLKDHSERLLVWLELSLNECDKDRAQLYAMWEDQKSVVQALTIEGSNGISPVLEISLVRAATPPDKRIEVPIWFILAGASASLALWMLANQLFRSRRGE